MKIRALRILIKETNNSIYEFNLILPGKCRANGVPISYCHLS